MKNKLVKNLLSAVVLACSVVTFSSLRNDRVNDEFHVETTDEAGRGAVNVSKKGIQVGDPTVTEVSETKAQYGLDADGNYRLRFVTAVTGDIGSLSYTLSKDGEVFGTYDVDTIYKSVASGSDILYYDGANFVKEASETTNNYYFACGSIKLKTPSYGSTKGLFDVEFSAQLTVVKSDDTTVSSVARSTTLNELVNYDYEKRCVADFESLNQLGGFTCPWHSTISRSSEYKTSGDYSMRLTLNNQYTITDITGSGLGVDSLSNYGGIKMNVYVEDTTETNVYDANTKAKVALMYNSTTIATFDITKANEWTELTFDLGTYNQYKLTDGSFRISCYKITNGTTNATGTYAGVTFYFDDIYVTPLYVQGDVVASYPYTDIYNQVAASETGYIAAGDSAVYGIGHGTSDNYAVYNASNKGTTNSATVSGINSTTAYVAAKTDNIVMFVEAKETCFAKFTIDETKFKVYVWGNVYIKKYDASANSWTQISMKQSDNAATFLPFMQCEYQKLNAGDKLTLEMTNLTGGARYYQHPSGITISEQIEKDRIPTSIEEVKSGLLDSENTFNALTTVNTLRTGGSDARMSIGLLSGTTELPVAPGGQNGWCGFTSDDGGANLRCQFLANTAPDAFYYTYTATSNGYVYIDQTLRTWNGDVKSSVVATVGEEVVYTTERTHVGDGLVDDKVAVYLETGETLKVQVNHLSNPSRSVFGFIKINVSFVLSSEFTLPEGYETLVDYLNA